MLRRLVKRGVLAHQAGDKTALRQSGHPVQHRLGIFQAARQGQVTQNHAPLQDAFPVVHRRAGKFQHPGHCLLTYGKVIRRAGIFPRKRRRHILHIRQPDIHVGGQPLHRFQRFVPAGVVHHRQGAAPPPGLVQGGQNPLQPGGGGHQIQVMGSFGLQFQKNFGQPFKGNLLAESLSADLPVLAVAAFQRAAAEKHRAAAPGAADAGLFPEMQRGPGHPQGAARPAVPGLPCTVGPAAAGAKFTSQNRSLPDCFKSLLLYHIRLCSAKGLTKPSGGGKL